MNPKVSICIATYNRAHILSRSIESVLSQSEKNIECIVVDDGSTDETESVLKTYTDARLRYIRLESNKGASSARNRGIEEARGEFVMVWDSDDILHPDAVAVLWSAHEAHPDAITLSAPARMVRGEKEVFFPIQPEGFVSLDQMLGKYLGNNEKVRMARKEVYLKAPYVSRNLDFMVGVRLSAQGPWFHLSKPLGTVVLDNADSLTVGRKKFNAARSAERARHLEIFLKEFGNRLKMNYPRRYAELAYGTGLGLYCAGDMRNARQWAREARATAPFYVRAWLLTLLVFVPRSLAGVFGFKA